MKQHRQCEDRNSSGQQQFNGPIGHTQCKLQSSADHFKDLFVGTMHFIRTNVAPRHT